jgi:hypothetical protein
MTVLSISNPVASFTTYTSDIALTTERNKITAVQLELNYDPKTISSVDIKPGTFFTNPTILLKKIDTVNGKITYVLGIGLGQKPINGNGTVAMLSFVPLTKSGTVAIDFQKDTKVTAAGVIESVLTSTSGLQFSLEPTPPPYFAKLR